MTAKTDNKTGATGKVTMSDIARHANVSVMTVSRALSGDRGMSQETRERILKISQRLHYTPNKPARSLVSGKSFLIALMIHEDPSSNYCSDLVSGVMKQCNKTDYGFILEDFRFYDLREADSILNRLARLKVDGLILPEFVSNNKAFMQVVEQQDIKHVRIASGPWRDGSPYVSIDNYRATYELTSYLLSLGHNKIGFIRGRKNEHVTDLRYMGFADALAARRLKPSSRHVEQGDFTPESGHLAAKKILARRNPPTALVASNDYMAAGVLKAAYEMGIRVPEDISVAGFDDIQLAGMTSPALTTVNQFVETQASVAVELLLDMINRKPPFPATVGHKLLNHQLVVRQSTGAPPRES